MHLSRLCVCGDYTLCASHKWIRHAFLVHLSQRLKCTIVITRCPSSVRRYFFTFSTSPLKLLNGIQRNFTGSKISTPSTKFVFFGPIGKTRRPPWLLICWDIFDFSSKTTERKSMKLDKKQDLNVLYQVCGFFSGRSEKQDGHSGLWLAETFSTSPLKPLNGIQRNLIESKITTSSTKFVFVCRSEKQDGRPDFWLAETFSTSPLKPLNGIQRNLTGSKISTSSTKFVFFGPIGKTRWPPRLLICWDIFDFSSKTTERNSMKLDKKQDLNVLYQVSVFFGPIGKTRWPLSPLICWDIFDFSSETTERNSRKLDRKQDHNVLYQVCVFLADRKDKMAALTFDWLRHFRLLLWNRLTEFNETWQEARSQRPLRSLCFSGRSEKNKMAALASDWLRHFRLLLRSYWTKFNETVQEARSQRPLLSLCFSVRSEKQEGRPGFWFAEIFSTSTLKPLNGIQWNLTRNKISMSSTKFVFFRADRKNKMATLAFDWLRHFRLLIWNHWTEFKETW